MSFLATVPNSRNLVKCLYSIFAGDLAAVRVTKVSIIARCLQARFRREVTVVVINVYDEHYRIRCLLPFIGYEAPQSYLFKRIKG